MQQWGPRVPGNWTAHSSHLFSSGSRAAGRSPSHWPGWLPDCEHPPSTECQNGADAAVPFPPGTELSTPSKKAYIIFRFPIPVRLLGLIHLTVLEFSTTCSLLSTLSSRLSHWRSTPPPFAAVSRTGHRVEIL